MCVNIRTCGEDEGASLTISILDWQDKSRKIERVGKPPDKTTGKKQKCEDSFTCWQR